MKYIDQYNMLTEAYIAGKVNPFNSCMCFVGNLLNGSARWALSRVFGDFTIDGYYEEESRASVDAESNGFYILEEIVEIEKAFMTPLIEKNYNCMTWDQSKNKEEAEETLFRAFEAGLDKLKEIHISKGEVIDEVPVFKKRELHESIPA